MKNPMLRLFSAAIVISVPMAQVFGTCLIQKPTGTPCANGVVITDVVGFNAERVSCAGVTTDHYPDVDVASNGQSGLTSMRMDPDSPDCHYTCTAYDSSQTAFTLSDTPGNVAWFVAGNPCTNNPASH